MPRQSIVLTFLEGGSLFFRGRVFEGHVVSFSSTALVRFPEQPEVPYILDPLSARIATNALLEIHLNPRSFAQQGIVKIKALNAKVVGWVPRPHRFHAQGMELETSEAPLNKPVVRTVLDWVLGDDPF